VSYRELKDLPNGLVKASEPSNSGEVKDINFGGLTAPNMDTPVADTDGANKAYVDDATDGMVVADYRLKDGQVLIGKGDNKCMSADMISVDEYTSSIMSVAQSSTTPSNILITAQHTVGVVNGNSVVLSDMTESSYDGIYEVQNRTSISFEVTADFVGTATGTWSSVTGAITATTYNGVVLASDGQRYEYLNNSGIYEVVNFGGNVAADMATPVEDTDGANKAYVDTATEGTVVTNDTLTENYMILGASNNAIKVSTTANIDGSTLNAPTINADAYTLPSGDTTRTIGVASDMAGHLATDLEYSRFEAQISYAADDMLIQPYTLDKIFVIIFDDVNLRHDIQIYNLTTPADVSTAVLDSTIPNNEFVTEGMDISSDGMILFLCVDVLLSGESAPQAETSIRAYNLASPWTIAEITGSPDATLILSGEPTNFIFPSACKFSPDGLHLFALEKTTGVLAHFTTPDAFNLNTCVFLESYDFGTPYPADNYPNVSFRDDGRSLYLTSPSYLYEFKLLTPWMLSSITGSPVGRVIVGSLIPMAAVVPNLGLYLYILEVNASGAESAFIQRILPVYSPNIATEVLLRKRVEFSTSTHTGLLGVASIYAYRPSYASSRSLYIYDNVIERGSSDQVFMFTVVDETGMVSAANTLTVTSSVAIIAPSSFTVLRNAHGALTFYTDGTSLYAYCPIDV
jgi:hypothetical protein